MSNTLTAILPKILARALPTLRQNAITPYLVNTGYSLTAGQKGKTVDVQVPVAQTAAAVTPSSTPISPADLTPTTTQVTLDKWYKTDFHLSDQEMTQIDKDVQFVPVQLGEAVKALGNQVDGDLLALYKDIYNYVGTAGTTPFADAAALKAGWTAGARLKLNSNLAPTTDRHLVLDVNAEANALSLAEFKDVSASGDPKVIIEGEIGRKLGAMWWMNQNVPSHTKGTLTPGTALQLNAEVAAGASSLVLKDSGGSLTGTVLTGDLLAITGATQTYVATADATAASNLCTVSISPVAAATYAASTAVTHVAGHVANVAMHRNAFALATAPLKDEAGIAIEGAIQDPVTGLVLRLEVMRQYKQTVWQLDILYGVKTVRATQACRILG